MPSERRIPRVAAAALVFGGGCADDPSNVDAEERAAIVDYATTTCAARQSCDPTDFGYYYVDFYDCADTLYTELVARVEDATDGYGEACGDALIAYSDCVAAALAAACDADTWSECYDEYAATSLCGGA